MPLKKLNLPKETIYQQFIPKNQFYKHGEFSQTQKNIFINNIEKITLYAQLTRENTNIAEYKDETRTYEEVSIFLIELRKKDNIEKIAQLILGSIPYPIILIGKHENECIFFGANQRDNQVDNRKIILERLYNTGYLNIASEFIDEINYKNVSKNNFYDFYNEYIRAIINFNLKKRNVSETENREELLNQIEKIEEEIVQLKNKMSKETQFNKKMELNMKIKSKEKALNKMEE